LMAGEKVWAEMTLIEACFPKGALGSAEAAGRRAFLRDRQFVEGVSLSRQANGETRLSQAEIDATDWMPGTVEAVYGTRDLETLATREHLAARERVHPSCLPNALPFSRPNVVVTRDGDDVVVADKQKLTATESRLDLSPLRDFWDSLIGVSGPWAGRDLMEGLIQRYVGRVQLEDPAGFAALQGKGAIFVGNHQVQIESVLITHILAGLSKTRVVTMANAKHEARWIGWLLGWLFRYPGCRDPRSIVYFDPAEPAQMFEILAGVKADLAQGGQSFFVHAQGTRARSAKEVTDTISSLFLDLAIEQNLPIVPVRFSRGLPVLPIRGKLEFPVGHSRQDYTIGRAIGADELAALPYAERRQRVLNALNETGMTSEQEVAELDALGATEETSLVGDLGFRDAIARWSATTGAGEVEATFFRVLEELGDSSLATRAMLEGARMGRFVAPADDEGRWMGELAERLFGPSGPEVVTSS
jgi:1-acyl-sn-glycerol-3-phosphate acyltransferase